MADYPTLANALAALGATINDPADTEDASKLAAAMRQTRQFVYNYLANVVLDPTTDQLRNTVMGGGTLPTGCIRGTNPVGGAQREILQKGILGADIADETIATANLANDSVTTAKLADDAVTSDKVLDGTLTGAKFADEAITTAKLANNSVTGDKIVAGTIKTGSFVPQSIAAADVIDHTLTGTKLETGAEGFIMVGGNGTDGQSFSPKQITGAISINKDGVAQFQGGLANSIAMAYTSIIERATVGTACGTSTTGWLTRGSQAASWFVESDINNQVKAQTDKIEVLKEGVYWMRVAICSADATSRGRIQLYADASKPGDYQTFYTTSGVGTAGKNYWLTWEGLVTFTFGSGQITTTTVTRPYFILQSTAGSGTSGGMGQPCSLPAAGTVGERYSHVHMIRLAST